MSNLKISKIGVTELAQNCRVLFDDSKCVVIDPGGDVKKIIEFLEYNKLNCSEIWLTHSHFDHCGGVKELKEITNAKLYGDSKEKLFRQNVTETLKLYGMFDAINNKLLQNCPEPDVYTDSLDALYIGNLEFKIISTPGHSPGHISFYCENENVLISGDVIFSGSIGRTDLPGGNHGLLLQTIKNKIFTLPDITKIMPGHGPDTTVGDEKNNNQFSREILSV